MVLPPRFCAEKEALQAVAVSLQGRLRANNRRGGGGGKAKTGAQERNHSITITHRKEDDSIFYTENRWEQLRIP
jgi:hypothetical protein